MIEVSILPMKLSGDRTEHYVRVSNDGRTIEVGRYSDRFYNRALYQRDSLSHVLLGTPKPDIMAPEYEDTSDPTEHCVNCGLGSSSPGNPGVCHNCGAEMVEHDRSSD